jgi:hypothetical protein
MALIKQLLSLFILTSITHSIFVDPTRVCRDFRKGMFSLIKVFKDFTFDDRQDLYQYSLRKYTFDFLQSIEFKDNVKLDEVDPSNLLKDVIYGVIEQNSAYLKMYSEYVNPENSSNVKKLAKLQNKLGSHMEKFHEQAVKFNEMIKTFNEDNATLKTLRGNLLSSESFIGNFKIYQKINEFEGAFNWNHDDPYNNLILLGTLEENLTILSPEQKELMKGFVTTYNDLNKINDMVQNYELNEKYVEGSFPALVQAHVNLKDSSIPQMKAIINSTFKEDKSKYDNGFWTMIKGIKAEAKRNIDSYENLPEVKANPQGLSYNKFKEVVEKVKKLIPKILAAKIELLKSSKIKDNLENQIGALQSMEMRIKSTDYFKVKERHEDQLDLENIVNGVQDDLSGLEQTAIELYEKYGQDSKNTPTRTADLQKAHEFFYRDVENLNKGYKETSKIIDIIFGFVLSRLQGAGGQGNLSSCLSAYELSMVLYYGQIFNVIERKKSFLKSFLQDFVESEQVGILKYLLRDLKGFAFSDNKIFNNDLTQFANDDSLLLGIKTYVMYMETEIDTIFHEQIKGVSYIKRKVMSVLSFVGIEIKYLTKTFITGGVKKVLILLTAALSIIFHVVTVAVVVVAIISYIVFLIMKYMLKGLKAILAKFPSAKNDFFSWVSHLMTVYGPNKPVESLNFEEILDDFQAEIKSKLSSSGNVESEEKWEERVDQFKNLFDKVTENDDLKDLENVIQVYDESF